MFSIFRKKPKEEPKVSSGLKVDIHSHFLPGLDDGAENLDETLEMLRAFADWGYSKVITTPHLIHDFYSHDENTIREKCAWVNEQLAANGVALEVEAAAEYFLDDHFMERVNAEDKSFITFGKHKFLLFETPVMNEPIYLKEALFKLRMLGFTPVMAHPERYGYLQYKFDKIEELVDGGLYMQVNIMSLSGYYNKITQKLAEKLIDKEMVHFLGSDCHKPKHLAVLKDAFKTKHYQVALGLELMNNKLAT
jgi:tyrosine-protein phosphatase YwqE